MLFSYGKKRFVNIISVKIKLEGVTVKSMSSCEVEEGTL